jgi:hypothetical protein
MPVPGRSVTYTWAAEDDPLAWIDSAACAGQPVDLFFPTKGEGYAAGKALCSRCPVLDACRSEIDRVEGNLSTAEVQGLFAGETPAERRRRRRAEVAAAADTVAA